MEFKFSDAFICYVNLPHRSDRRAHMQKELARVGIKATRAVALKTSDYNWPMDKVSVMWNRTKGAIGCHYSQYAVMKEGLNRGKHTIVLEDDLTFCDDFLERMSLIEQSLELQDWDIMFLGCCFHNSTQSKYQWHKSVNGKHTHPDMKLCNCDLNTDAEKTYRPYIVRAYGVWSTYAYIVNYNSIPRILKMLDDNVHLSMGIDWLFMYLAPQMKQYAFVPGCVKQYDNQSDIGTGITKFSAFKGLGEHWYAERMSDFDYQKFYRNL